MIRRPPRSAQSRSSAASDVYKRQALIMQAGRVTGKLSAEDLKAGALTDQTTQATV
ncbi:hypothetical protein CDFC105_03938 [Clostridioides difficile]|nr:hypothetical protein CDFC105_03938 [Clostridioides difficile]